MPGQARAQADDRGADQVGDSRTPEGALGLGVIALDTNVLARLLLRDDSRQHERVLPWLAQPGDFTAPITVMLELVWVLEVNDCSVLQIAEGLELLLRLPNFKPAEPQALRAALAL